jgi:hypothetical protein
MLMKIDQFGNIIVPPKVALSTGVAGNNFKGAAISPGLSTQTMNIWFQRGTFGSAEYQAILNLHDFGITQIRRLSLRSVNYFSTGFHVTQKDRNNFLTFHERGGNRQSTGPLMGAGISNGRLDGSTWQISPKGEVTIEAGGVSRDGLMAFFTDVSGNRSKLYLQPLRASGKRDGPPFLAKVSQQYVGLYCVDVSNVLPDQKRMALYFQYLGGCGFISRLQVRPVNAKTGEPVGKGITLFNSYDFIWAALDESARFVLYGDYNLLHFRALDATGHKSGPPKVIFHGVNPIGFIDIMKE